MMVMVDKMTVIIIVMFMIMKIRTTTIIIVISSSKQQLVLLKELRGIRRLMTAMAITIAGKNRMRTRMTMWMVTTIASDTSITMTAMTRRSRLRRVRANAKVPDLW